MTYTLREAADMLGVSPRTVRRRVTSGALEGRLVQGRYGPEYVIEADALEAHQAAGRAVAPVGSTLSAALARDADLIRELVERIAALERENGALQARLDAPRRSWWARLRGAG